MRDEGVIKFECFWEKSKPLPERDLGDLIRIRKELFGLALIGVYPDGIGYGNLSLRDKKHPGQFIITGSQTGHLKDAGPEHFALVTGYDIARNRVECKGPVKASSESLTHAMIYEIFPRMHGIIHVHSHEMWQRLQGKVPTTSAEVPYGTPEMAGEMKRLASGGHLSQDRILVMAGHEDGVITFGKDLMAARKVLLSFLTP